MNTTGRVEIFLEVVKHSSFAKAAKALGMTGPAASKQVMALEDELGVKLLHRTTRLVTLTDEGAVYYERARLAIEELKEAAAQIQDMKAAPKGVLKVSAPLSFAHMHLLPVFSSFARKYPDIRMDIMLEDRRVDVLAEGYDLVIRIGALVDSTLIVKPLARCPLYLVASHDYVKNKGVPQVSKDLKEHHFIAYAHESGAGEWRYKDPNGKQGSVKTESVFKANTAEMMLHAAFEGLGIALLPAFSVATHLKSGQLLRLLPMYETFPCGHIAALMPPNRYRSNKVKLLMDWLAGACKAIHLE